MILFISKTPIRFSPWRRRLAASLEYIRSWRNMYRPMRGPAMLEINLVKSLQMQTEHHWDFCFRDFPLDPVDVIWAVSRPADLRWAIASKKRLGGAQLWAGPAISVLPDEENGLLRHPSIDRIYVPSEWVKDLFEQPAPKPKRITASQIVSWMDDLK